MWSSTTRAPARAARSIGSRCHRGCRAGARGDSGLTAAFLVAQQAARRMLPKRQGAILLHGGLGEPAAITLPSLRG